MAGGGSIHTKLLDALVEHFRALGEERSGESTFWAWSRLDDLVHSQPDEAWRLLGRLIPAVADSELALANVAAGPLEDLLRLHGVTYAPAVIAAADRAPSVRDALQMVWPESFVPEVRDQLERWREATFMSALAAYARNGTSTDVWAWENLADLIPQNADLGWRVLANLLAEVGDSAGAATKISDGPLQELLRLHGSTHLATVMAAAEGDARIAQALRRVPTVSLTADVREILQGWMRGSA